MKNIVFRLFFLLLIVFAFTSKVSAQAPPIQASLDWKCMRGEPKELTFTGARNENISQELYADGYDISGDAYIVTCVGTEAGGLCTTTNPEYDQLLFGADNSASFPYKVVIEGGSKKQLSLGKLKATATVSTEGLTGGMSFFGVTIKGEGTPLEGRGASQQLGETGFSEGVTQKCVYISWNTVFPPPPRGGNQTDPFGIVFDSQSLEPLPNVSVTILDKDKKIHQELGMRNPQVTKADGLFNFLVASGTYFLTVSPPSGYQFVANPNLHPNYIRVYHQLGGADSLYKPNESIVEASGIPEHRDIPLDPGTNAPYIAEPSKIAYKESRSGDITKIDGKVSHPFSEVIFSQNGNPIKKVTANRFGSFVTEYNNSTLVQNQDVLVTFKKADLKTVNIPDIVTGSSLQVLNIKKDSIIGKVLSNLIASLLSPLAKNTLAQSSLRIASPTSTKEDLKLSPILPYIEGYAYDQNNKILPNAVVRLKLKMNNASVYETKADKNGYFKILSKYIPIFPYYLEILSETGKVMTYSTSEFAKQNEEYLDTNKINLAAGTKNNKSLIIDSPDSTASGKVVNPYQNSNGNANQQGIGASKSKTETAAAAASNSKLSSMLMLILTIFVFIVLIGLTVFFIIKNKNNSSVQQGF